MSEWVSVAYFLEDVAHERLIRGLVQRAAQDNGVSLNEDVRNATHGSRVWIELRQYLRDIQQRIEPKPDLLIAVIDGNCRKFKEVRQQIRKLTEPLQIRCICAVPNPHIERWYLGDAQAWQKVLPGTTFSALKYKCERDRYKNALIQAIRQAGVIPALGGAEYGDELARIIDTYKVGRRDNSFKAFWKDLNNELKLLATL